VISPQISYFLSRISCYSEEKLEGWQYNRGHPCGRILHQGSGDRQFDMLEFVVDRGIADRDLLLHLTVGGMDGGLLIQDDFRQQFDQSGEQQFVGVLPLCRTCEQLIEVFGVEDTLESTAGHDTNGLFLDEGFKHVVEQHGGVPPQ
jgi:hypothetical protein